MGRGRAKAKQQKVARDLKYNTQHTDLGALQNELSGHHSENPQPPSKWDDEAGDDFEDDGRWASAR